MANLPPEAYPDYQNAAYLYQAAIWNYLDDVARGSDAWTDRAADGTCRPNAKAKYYLPAEPQESPESYLGRFQRSPFQNRFAGAIRDFCSLVFTNGLRLLDPHPAIALAWDNVDLHGTPAELFLFRVALAAMRRGHTFLLIDLPRDRATTQAEAQTRRPYWVHIEAPQIVNWRFEGDRLTMVVIAEYRVLPYGMYGERPQLTYKVLTPGGFEVFQVSKNPNTGEKTATLIDSGITGVVAPNGTITPFDFIPLIPVYGGDRQGEFISTSPLKALADLNVAHYQTHSDHRNKVHKTCFPVPVFLGGDAPKELVLGPDTLLSTPPGGGFVWAEPQASSLNHSRQEMLDLELAMDFLSAQYLIKPADRQAAASTMVQAAKVESSLYQFQEQFSSAIALAFQIHLKMMGIFAPAGSVVMNTTFFQSQQTDSQLLMAYVHLFQQLPTLSTEHQAQLMELLKQRSFLSGEINA